MKLSVLENLTTRMSSSSTSSSTVPPRERSSWRDDFDFVLLMVITLHFSGAKTTFHGLVKRLADAATQNVARKYSGDFRERESEGFPENPLGI